jgi:hypothetical protein
MSLLIWRSLTAIALVALGGWLRAAVAQTIEPDVKAAFIYNFTKFIEWPLAAIPPDRFRICTVGDARVASALATIIEGESAGGRPLVHEQPKTADDARRCQILYIGSGDAERGARLLAAVRQAPVLSAGEGAGFAERGGGIGFVVEHDRVRFDINLRAVERPGLKVSSRLLRIARKVVGGPR